MISPLAEGGQSVVYRAWDPVLLRDVVIKKSKRRFEPGEESFSRISHEGTLLANLDHPGVVQIYDVGVDDGAPYLVLERIAGKTLQKSFEQHRPSARLLRNILMQIADAVSAVHQQGILHLDLKPENVIFTPQEECKLIDFGVAWSFREPDGPALRYSVGTTEYMAPEQCRGESGLWSPSTDVYGLGGIMHFLKTGQPPGISTCPACPLTWKSLLWEQWPFPCSLTGICRRALSLERDQRYESAADFCAALGYSRAGMK